VQPLTSTKLFAEAALAVIALITIIVSSPMLVSKARLIAERNQARAEADSLRDAVAAFQIGLGALDRLRAEVLEVRAVQIISTRFVADLVGFIRTGGAADNMPTIPAELRDDVLEALRDRARDAQGVADAVAASARSGRSSP
jgi:hypothetical protein